MSVFVRGHVLLVTWLEEPSIGCAWNSEGHVALLCAMCVVVNEDEVRCLVAKLFWRSFRNALASRQIRRIYPLIINSGSDFCIVHDG